MTPTPQEIYERVLARADDDRRLPLPAQSMWEIFPFEPDSLRFKRDHLDLGDLSDGMAAELGVLSVRVVRSVEALADLGEARA